MRKIEEYVTHLKLEGWCLIQRVIPEDRIPAVREEVIAGHQQAIKDYDAWGGSWGFQNGPNGEPGKCLVAYVPSLAAYFADERILGVAQAMLDPHVRIAQTEFKTRPPNDESNRRSWHTDFPHDLTDREQAGRVRMPFPDVTMGLTALWILDPFDADSRIWHSSAANPSSEPRVTVLTRYSPWWLSLEFVGRNNAIVPRTTYESMPDAVKLLYRHRAEGEKDPLRVKHE